MRDFIIVTDSGSDLPNEIINKYNVKVAGLLCTFNGKEVKDDLTDKINIDDFYDAIEKGDMPSTSMVNPPEFISIFESILKEGKDIIYVSLSSKFSGTYNSSLIAKENLLKEYKNAKIQVIDSLSATMAEGLLVYEACKLKALGKSFDEVVTFLNDNVLNAHLWFMVEDLNHLKRGGRISGAQAVVGNLLNIKPIITADKEGKLSVYDKVRGRKKSIKTIVEQFKQRCSDIKNSTVCIVYTNCEEEAKELESEMRALFPKEVLITKIRLIIGTHAGPLAMGLTFLGDKRKE